LVVITETIASFGAILIVTSVLTGPLLIAVMVPAKALRALIFMASRPSCRTVRLVASHARPGP
jgi:hypothetical protein